MQKGTSDSAYSGRLCRLEEAVGDVKDWPVVRSKALDLTRVVIDGLDGCDWRTFVICKSNQTVSASSSVPVLASAAGGISQAMR